MWNADIVTNTFLNFEYNYQVEFQNIMLNSYLSKSTQNLLKKYSNSCRYYNHQHLSNRTPYVVDHMEVRALGVYLGSPVTTVLLVRPPCDIHHTSFFLATNTPIIHFFHPVVRRLSGREDIDVSAHVCSHGL